MTRDEIVQELDKYVKNIDSHFSVNDDFGDLNLDIDNEFIAYFIDFDEDNFAVTFSNSELVKEVLETDIIKKFYNKAVELLKKNKRLYTVQAIKNDKCSFLNYCYEFSKYIFRDKQNDEVYKTQFTESEIEALKQRDDIAIDWDKAIIKEVK